MENSVLINIDNQFCYIDTQQYISDFIDYLNDNFTNLDIKWSKDKQSCIIGKFGAFSIRFETEYCQWLDGDGGIKTSKYNDEYIFQIIVSIINRINKYNRIFLLNVEFPTDNFQNFQDYIKNNMVYFQQKNDYLVDGDFELIIIPKTWSNKRDLSSMGFFS